MNAKKSSNFRPTLQRLETRAVPASVNAVLSHGVLTVTRDDVSVPIQIDVLTIGVRRHGGAMMHTGTVVVEGVARFNLKKVKAIAIEPGASAANITVNEPPKGRIPFVVHQTAIATLTAPPASPGGQIVPGVTGVESALEQAIFNLINAQRSANGIAPLAVNAKLVTASQIHARDMASLDMLQHNLSGVAQPTLVSRANFVGYKYGWLGENVASYFSDAQSVVTAWMASPEHRSNILQANFTEAGIGVGRDPMGHLFFCIEFGSPGA